MTSVWLSDETDTPFSSCDVVFITAKYSVYDEKNDARHCAHFTAGSSEPTTGGRTRNADDIAVDHITVLTTHCTMSTIMIMLKEKRA